MEIGNKIDRSQDKSNWGSPNTLEKHFENHGKDFGAKNELDYAKKANDFYKNAQKNGYEKILGKDGVQRIYDTKENTFGSYNPDGTTRTYFKPSDGQSYWENQVNDLQKNTNL